MKRNFYIFALLGLIIFSTLSFFAFKRSLTPYVSFLEAKRNNNIVQIAGNLEKTSITYSEENSILQFKLKEKDGTEIISVLYKGPKPLNFEDAISVVAIGSYDGKNFIAKQLLVKCPSKYQGTKLKRKYE